MPSGGSSGGPGGRGAPLSEINVTPLVDVMLVLLIIFMVAAPMMTMGVPVNLPDAEAPTLSVDEESLIVSIAEDGSLSLGEDTVTLAELQTRLTQDAALRERDELYVRADENVRYGEVARVLALIRNAGIGKMGLVTEAPSANPDAEAPAP